MSLAIVACTCGNVENLARRVLAKSGCNYWLDVPFYSGQERFLDFLRSLPTTIPKKDIEILKIGVGHKSSYVIIVGYTHDHMVWADLKGGDLRSQLDAEVIAREFA